MLYDSPYYSAQDNLEVAIGAIEFANKTIKNLREQIKNLRESLSNYECAEVIDANQYKHLKSENLDLNL